MDNSIKQNKMYYTKTLTLSIFLLQLVFQVLYGQKEVVFPAEFPSELIGKKLCGTMSTTGKMMNGYTTFLDVPFELFISKDFGIYARYNPGDKFGKDEWGSTPIISNFVLWKTSDEKDRYGDVYGRTYYYKTPDYDLNSKCNIESFTIYNFFGSEKNPPSKSINLGVFIPHYKSGSISSFYKSTTVCEILVSQEELRTIKIADDQKRCLLIDQLYIDKKIDEAKSEMGKLNFPEKYKNKKNIDAEYISFIKTKKDRETTEDINNINTIRILLKSNSIEKVVQAWVSLHSNTNLQNIKDSIFQFILKNETGNIPISLANSDLTKFIELNKVQIGNSYKSITKDTNIIIQFDQLGKCLQKESYTWNSSIFKKYSTDFFTYQTLQFPVSLKIIDTKIKNKAELPYAGTKKTLGLSRNGKIYKVNLLTVDIIGLTVWEKNYDEKLAKNEVRIEVFFTRNLFANEIPIDSKEILKSNNQKLNPRTLRVVGRGASIAAILGWFGLRIIENQTIK